MKGKTPELTFRGKKYALNIEKVFSFLEKYESKERVTNEILDNFESGGTGKLAPTASAKAIREYKTPGNGTIDSMYYDFIKNFLDIIIASPYTEADLEKAPLGLVVCFNTLIKYEFITEI